MESSFQKKMSMVKQTLAAKETALTNENMACNGRPHACTVELKGDGCRNKTSRQQLTIQQPIIIQKKTAPNLSRPQSAKRLNSSNMETKTKITRREVEVFTPISIPPKEKRLDLESLSQQTHDGGCSNKEIQIKIEKDDKKDKECLKKLFKKVHKLTEELAAAQKQNMQLKVELDSLKNVQKSCNGHEKIITRLEGQKYKVEVELDMLRKLMKDRDEQIKMLNARTPKQIIKEVVIEKPVEIMVEVPKHIPGPERIVQKIVEVPKYVEIEKKVPVSGGYQPPKEVIRTVEVPTIVEKPVYIDKPIYIDRPYQVERRVEVPVQVPIEVPIYVDRPCGDDEHYITKIRHLEGEMESLITANDQMCRENNELRVNLEILTRNLEVLSRHNHEKNRQTELMMQNSFDYYPISPGPEVSLGSVRYSVSSHPHPRII